MKFTPDSIPDEEIDTLWREACGTALTDADPDLMHLCTVAVNRNDDFTTTEQQHARVQISLLLNRRTTAAQASELTADTITDEQIRELRYEQRREGHQLNAEICDTALGHLRGVRGQVVSFAGNEVRDARARCAEILNARAKAVTP